MKNIFEIEITFFLLPLEFYLTPLFNCEQIFICIINIMVFFLSLGNAFTQAVHTEGKYCTVGLIGESDPTHQYETPQNRSRIRHYDASAERLLRVTVAEGECSGDSPRALAASITCKRITMILQQ